MGPEAPTRTVVRSLICPSDGLGGVHSRYTPGGLELATWNHSNYLAFFGDRNFGAGLPQAVQPNRRAAFGINSSANLLEITNGNGTSTTMIFGEYLTGLPQAEIPSGGVERGRRLRVARPRAGDQVLHRELPLFEARRAGVIGGTAEITRQGGRVRHVRFPAALGAAGAAWPVER